MALAPNGLKFYLACDLSGQTSGPTGGFNGGGTAPPNAGSILEYTYTGIILPANEVVYQHPLSEKVIKVYPVPAYESVTVSIKSDVQKPYFIGLYSTSGKLIREIKSIKNETLIKIADLPSGIYFIQVKNAFEQIQHTEKIIKL